MSYCPTNNPDSKVQGANMGPIWGRQVPGGPLVGPLNFAIWDVLLLHTLCRFVSSAQPEYVAPGIFHTNCLEIHIPKTHAIEMFRIDTVFDLCIIDLTLILYVDIKKLKNLLFKKICYCIMTYMYTNYQLHFQHGWSYSGKIHTLIPWPPSSSFWVTDKANQ